MQAEYLKLSLRATILADPRSATWKSLPHARLVDSSVEPVRKERLGDTETTSYAFRDRSREHLVRCWFGADDGIIRKQVRLIDGKESGSFRVTKVEINPKLDPALFTYKPPAGIAVSDQTEFQAKVLKLALEGS
jgi:hypothetical protein